MEEAGVRVLQCMGAGHQAVEEEAAVAAHVSLYLFRTADWLSERACADTGSIAGSQLCMHWVSSSASYAQIIDLSDAAGHNRVLSNSALLAAADWSGHSQLLRHVHYVACRLAIAP